MWHGLQIRAKNGDDRCVPDHRFEILEDTGDHLLRRVHLRKGTTDAAQELHRISFQGQRLTMYDFVEGPQKSVVVCFGKSDDKGEYHLRHTHLTEMVGVAHSSDDEAELAARRRPMMMAQPGRHPERDQGPGSSGHHLKGSLIGNRWQNDPVGWFETKRAVEE